MTVQSMVVVAYAFMSCGCEVDLYEDELDWWLSSQVHNTRARCPKCNKDYKAVMSILPDGFVPVWKRDVNASMQDPDYGF